ncbi:hypothetical protein DFH28DRAFT_962052 [Melampsora americana]|nr:hypothetical protein DFH28DRAFT_962052 [Melampsora americana]
MSSSITPISTPILPSVHLTTSINTPDDLRTAVPRYVAKILSSLRAGQIVLSKDSGWGELEKGESLSVQDLMDPRARAAVAKMALELAKKEIQNGHAGVGGGLNINLKSTLNQNVKPIIKKTVKTPPRSPLLHQKPSRQTNLHHDSSSTLKTRPTLTRTHSGPPLTSPKSLSISPDSGPSNSKSSSRQSSSCPLVSIRSTTESTSSDSRHQSPPVALNLKESSDRTPISTGKSSRTDSHITPTSTRPPTPNTTQKSNPSTPTHRTSIDHGRDRIPSPIAELLPDYPIQPPTQTRLSRHHQASSTRIPSRRPSPSTAPTTRPSDHLSSTRSISKTRPSARQSDTPSRHPTIVSSESAPLASTLPTPTPSLVPPKPPTPPPPPPLPAKFMRSSTTQKTVSRPPSPAIARAGSKSTGNPTTRRNSTNTLTPTIVSLPYITLNIDSKPVKFLCDTGSMLNLMSTVVRDRLGLVMRSAPGTVMGVTGASICEGVCEGSDGLGVVMVTPDGRSFCRARFVVGPTGQSDCILGMPFFVENRAEVRYVPGKGTLVSFETRRRSEEEEKDGSLVYQKLSQLGRRRITTVATEEADVLRGYDWPGQASQAHISTHHVSLSRLDSVSTRETSQIPSSINPKLSVPSRPVLPSHVVMKEMAQSEQRGITTSYHTPSLGYPGSGQREIGSPGGCNPRYIQDREGYLHHSPMASMDLRDSIPPFLDVRSRSRSRSGSFQSFVTPPIPTHHLGSHQSVQTSAWLKARTSLEQDLRGFEVERLMKERNGLMTGERGKGLDEMIYEFLQRSTSIPNRDRDRKEKMKEERRRMKMNE